MLDESVFTWMVTCVAAAPALSLFLIAALWMIGPTPGERLVRALSMLGNVVSLLCAIGVGVSLAAGLHPEGTVRLGTWFAAGGHELDIGFRVDALSAVMMILVAFVTGLIGHFSRRYVHKQRGFTRFFLLLAVFATGMQLLVMGASLDQLFVGWELVGVTSALLVAYFHHRRTPVQSALRVYVTYRSCDLGLLVGAVLLHQAAGTSELAIAAGGMRSHAHLGDAVTTLVPLALLLATMGKSAQFPFGGWLPRAMEGPTASSALFYGALSVHAGVYLLLRAQPLFAASPIATAALIAVGASTAVHGTLVGRVQTDAKSTLAYATMTQVGLMFVEVGLGLTTFVVLHLVAHVILRCLQLLRAPSALRDAKAIRAAGVAADGAPLIARMLPQSLGVRMYRLALERFGLEPMFDRLLVEPLLSLGLFLDRAERRWIATLAAFPSGQAAPEPIPEAVVAHTSASSKWETRDR